ncbi:hypothetical protein BURMUCF1_0839 [Burkholderia multivorans ATCC BAA-247]|nr:hypothetical protein BURMUCF1_0839 [Burkholderia multivorans ATCC BAA-247]
MAPWPSVYASHTKVRIGSQAAEGLKQLIIPLILKITACGLQHSNSRSCLQRDRHAVGLKLRVLV